MSTVDDRTAGETERQLAEYFAWLEHELGPVVTPAPGTSLEPAVQPAPDGSTRTWWWLAAAAAVVALVAGLAIAVGRDGGDRTVPASPTGDLRDVSGWFELALPGVEVVEPFTTKPDPILSAADEPYYVWADLDGDPIRAMSASFPAGDVPLDLDDDIDPPARVADAPGGGAWVVDDPAAGDRVLRVQWTRADGSVVLTSGTGIDAATLARWTFAIGVDESRPPAPPDPALELVLDVATVEPRPQYQETWMVDGAELSAWVSTEAPATWLGLGFPTVNRITVAGREGYRFGGSGDDQVLVTFPLRNGYWGSLSMPADRADELVGRIVVVDDTLPTPDEVASTLVGHGDDDPSGAATLGLAPAWGQAVAEELAAEDPDLSVDLTTASETYPIAAVTVVPIDTGGRLLVDLRVWATGEYDDESAWFEATGATRYGTSFPEGAVFTDMSETQDRVGIVTEHGVIQLIVERPLGGDAGRPLTALDDPDALDEAVGLVRRLALDLPGVLAGSGVDVDAGTVCVDRACEDGQVLARLEIPSADVDASVVGASRTDDLEDGPGLAPGSVPIGSPGVIRIWGHRTTYGAPLRELDELETGDEIVLTTPAGATFTYRVESVEVVDHDTPVPPSRTSTLVLSTFHPMYTSRQELRVTARICTTCLLGSAQETVVLPTP